MTYTTQQLQGMSDFEVNKALFKKLGNRCSYQEGTDGGLVFENWSIIDYCNNPNDIMPLAFERKIRLEYSHLVECWAASAWKKTGAREQTMIASFGDKDNPLRAIACLILMMDK